MGPARVPDVGHGDPAQTVVQSAEGVGARRVLALPQQLLDGLPQGAPPGPLRVRDHLGGARVHVGVTARVLAEDVTGHLQHRHRLLEPVEQRERERDRTVTACSNLQHRETGPSPPARTCSTERQHCRRLLEPAAQRDRAVTACSNLQHRETGPSPPARTCCKERQDRHRLLEPVEQRDRTVAACLNLWNTETGPSPPVSNLQHRETGPSPPARTCCKERQGRHRLLEPVAQRDRTVTACSNLQHRD